MKRQIGLLLTLFFIVSAGAQEITVTVDAPDVVAVGEQFMVTWSINSRGGEFQPPKFGDFYFLMGPNTSYSSSTQIINGKVTSVIKNSFSYYLQATAPGKFTIDPARYTEKRSEYLSKPIQIEVVSAGSARTTEAQPGQKDAIENDSSPGTDLYVRLIVNRSKIYLGEHVVATLKLYSKINLSGIQEYKFPDFNSFYKDDIVTEPPRNLERENVNGEIYGTAVLQRFLLYPQRVGSIEIEPATLTVLVQEQKRSNDPFFGDFFSSFNTVPKVLATLPVKIEVKPLPPTSASTFTGTVGKVSVKSERDKDTLAVNDALTYKIVISGNGNLKLANAPELNISPDIEIYEPKTSSNLTTSISGTSGSRTFEYLLIPRYHGSYTIPAYRFTYFDPDEDRYKTVETEEQTFNVSKSDKEDSSEVFGGISREDVRYLGKDIRYIRDSLPKLRREKNMLISGSPVYLLFGIATLLFALIILFRREQVKRNSDLSKVKNRKAARVASKRLKKAYNSLKSDNSQQFYAELLQALWGYLGDKFNIPVSKLTREMVGKTLEEYGFEASFIDFTGTLLDKCEYSRYSPTGSDSTLSDSYNQAVKVIKGIEDKV